MLVINVCFGTKVSYSAAAPPVVGEPSSTTSIAQSKILTQNLGQAVQNSEGGHSVLCQPSRTAELKNTYTRVNTQRKNIFWGHHLFSFVFCFTSIDERDVKNEEKPQLTKMAFSSSGEHN